MDAYKLQLQSGNFIQVIQREGGLSINVSNNHLVLNPNEVSKLSSLLPATAELQGLIEKAYSDAYDACMHHEEYSKAWNQFKKENNL